VNLDTVKRALWQEKKRLSVLACVLKDFLCLPLRPQLIPLHASYRGQLRRQRREWPHYSYSAGYFYQGWRRVGITGSRMTGERFRQYGLDTMLRKDMRVLDIGANVGFLSCAIAELARHVDAVEINPYLTEIGRATARWLGLDNIDFFAADYLQFEPQGNYDLLLSCANHHTDDQNMRPSLDAYIRGLADRLRENGLLLFESHNKDITDEAFEDCLESAADPLFTIERKEKLTFSDAGGTRWYYLFRKR